MSYSTSEMEAIGLCISLEAINDIANHALVELRDVSKYPGEAEVYFHDYVHRDLFIIRLLDFSKEVGDSKLTGVSGSCLSILKQACSTKSFDKKGSVEKLEISVVEFESWLEHEVSLTLWLPSLGLNAEIKMPRKELIFISGNYSKHNLSRLTAISKYIQGLLQGSGYEVSLENIPLALEDFREHLQGNYFIYYGTWLTEHLNNIRWGLQHYLMPIFQESFKKENSSEISYKYEYPTSITHEISKQWFWRLMNHIRTEPYLKNFKGAHYLKEQSSLERIKKGTLPFK